MILTEEDFSKLLGLKATKWGDETVPSKVDCFGVAAVSAGTAVTATMMAANAAIIGAISIGISVYGQMQQSKAAKNQAKFQEETAKNQAILAERNAKEIEKQGKKDSNRYRARVQQELANEMISMVGQGGDVSVGSNVDLLADYAGAGEEDAMTIMDNANRKAYNARTGGMNATNQANLFGAKAASINPTFDGVSTGVSGLSSVASNWAFSSANTGGGGGKYTPDAQSIFDSKQI
mgnify:FL=1